MRPIPHVTRVYLVGYLHIRSKKNNTFSVQVSQQVKLKIKNTEQLITEQHNQKYQYFDAQHFKNKIETLDLPCDSPSFSARKWCSRKRTLFFPFEINKSLSLKDTCCPLLAESPFASLNNPNV